MTWGLGKIIRSDRFIVCSLLLLAIALYLSGIGDLALRDWDEGIVAGVARNIWRGFPDGDTWLYPTINYDDPYWNKPPLVHCLVAFSYSLFGISEWSTRLFPALLSAFTIPLVYEIGREIFNSRLPAVFSALVYLTLLPVTRHGRVAMLDGAINLWFCLAVWCLLKGRKDRRWLLGMGVGIGAICLTKGIMMGVLLGGIIIIFLLWDNPKLLLSPYLWTSLILGVAPAVSWYVLQYLRYGSEFLGISLGKQTFNRIWEPVSNRSQPPWYYCLEIAKYSLPWLIFLPYSIKLAFKTIFPSPSPPVPKSSSLPVSQSGAKLTLTWCVVYLLATSLMATKLPWYIMPIYPGLSLLIGNGLAIAWQEKIYPLSWKIAFSSLAVICWITCLYLGLSGQIQLDLALIISFIALTFTIAAIILFISSHNFIPVTIGGFYLALLFFFNSPHWLWELNEAFPVKPLAVQIQEHIPYGENIYASYPNLRPSLEFYSDRVIIPATDEQLQQIWKQERPVYLLLDSDAINCLNFEKYVKARSRVNDTGWQIFTRDNQ